MNYFDTHFLGNDERVHEKGEDVTLIRYVPVIQCKDCRHNGRFDTDCPITWNKTDEDYCSFAES